MSKIMKLNVFSIFALLILSGNFLTANADYYPNKGTFTYNGRYRASTSFTWNSPGPWRGTGPEINEISGYEHDLLVRNPLYFAAGPTANCTTWTSLPDWYDDCITAGVDEDGDSPVFNFGTYRTDKIVAGKRYFGSWVFHLHLGAQTSFMNLNGQENANECICCILSPWCMFAKDTEPLLKNYRLNWNGIKTTKSWNR